jgi:hypothetical protein
VSLNPTPLSALAVFGLVIVNVNEVFARSAMLPAPNALLIVGGARTVRVALLLATPNPDSFDCGALVAVVCAPAVPVILTVSVQVDDGAMVPPPKFRVVSPGVAFHVPVQVEPIPAGLATCKPGGKLSEKLTPVRGTLLFGLLRVKVSCDRPPNGIVVGRNAMLTVGGAATVIMALAVLPVPPFPELTVTLLVSTPDVVPLTVATTVQEFPGVAMDAPPSEIVPELLTAVTDPLQLLLGTGGFTTTMPLGRLSINVIVVSAPGFAAGLVIVKVTVVVPPTGIDDAPNALVI